MSDLRAGPYTLPIGRFANVYLKDQTASIAATTLVTPPKGLYRVSLALAIVNADDVLGQLTASVLSKGDNSFVVTQSLTTINTDAFNIAQDAFICECDGVAPLQYSVTFVGTRDVLLYSLRGVVEQLSALT